MDKDIVERNHNRPEKHLFKGIGNFHDHKYFELYDKYFFKGM